MKNFLHLLLHPESKKHAVKNFDKRACSYALTSTAGELLLALEDEVVLYDTASKEIKKSFPDAQFTKQMLKEIKERFSTVDQATEAIKVTFPVNGKPTEFDITEQMRAACQRIVPPIVEGLGKLIGTFDPEFQERLKNRVLLAGGGSQIKGLDRAITAEMHSMLGGGNVIRIEEPIYGGANGALKIAHDMPEEYWEQLK